MEHKLGHLQDRRLRQPDCRYLEVRRQSAGRRDHQKKHADRPKR